MTAPRTPSLVRSALHLAVLSAFAFAQPLFDLLGRTPEFFVARGSTTTEVVVFALAILVVPPAVLLVAEALAGLVSSRARAGLHLVFVAALAAVVVLQAIRQHGDLPPVVFFVAAGLLGLAFAAAYAYAPPVRLFMTVLAIAPVVFLALFIARSPVGKLEENAKALPLPPLIRQPPVVMILLDEFPTMSLEDSRHRIDAVRYPSFARLARTATWYRNATAVHEHTTEAVPSILTGLYPKPDQLPLVADHPNNVFTLLGRRYGMHVFESVTQLCPERLCHRERPPFGTRMKGLTDDLGIVYLHLLLPKKLERRLPSISNTWQNFGDQGHGETTSDAQAPLLVTSTKDIDRAVGRTMWEDPRSQFERWTAGIHPTARPTLDLIHILLPHYPWRFLPDGKQYGNALGIDGLDIDTWTKDPWLVEQGWQRHLLQVGFTDGLLGEVIDQLKKEGVYDRSLLIVTADHGVSFRPGDQRRSITKTNIPDIAPVPLFVKLPGQHKARIDDRDAETVDIVPTIADVLGIRMPYRPDGRSLLGPAGPQREVIVRARSGPTVDASFASVTRRKYLTLDRQIRLFGQHNRIGLYAIGPHHELVARRVASVPAGRPSPATVSIDGQTLLRAVDLASQLSPSHVTGRVSGAPEGRDLDLAVAVNGEIGAVTRTFVVDGDVRFSAFVPESEFRKGANDVDVYVVASRGKTVELERMRGDGAQQQYALAGSVLLAGRRAFPVVPGALRGKVEDWFFEQQSVRIGGWAGDVANGRLPDAVVVFVDGRFLYAGTTTVGRPSIQRRFGKPGLRHSGFVFDLPRDLVGTGGHELRVFAVRGGVASELDYPKGFPWPRRT